MLVRKNYAYQCIYLFLEGPRFLWSMICEAVKDYQVGTCVKRVRQRQYNIQSLVYISSSRGGALLLRVAVILSIEHHKKQRKRYTDFFVQLASSQQLFYLQHVSPELDLLHLVTCVLQGSEEINLFKKKFFIFIEPDSRHLFKFVELRVWFILGFISSSLVTGTISISLHQKRGTDLGQNFCKSFKDVWFMQLVTIKL